MFVYALKFFGKNLKFYLYKIYRSWLKQKYEGKANPLVGLDRP
jgi:hypothetical protein